MAFYPLLVVATPRVLNVQMTHHPATEHKSAGLIA
jgi:hypothetical protein